MGRAHLGVRAVEDILNKTSMEIMTLLNPNLLAMTLSIEI
jgi:hypothetical protein